MQNDAAEVLSSTDTSFRDLTTGEPRGNPSQPLHPRGLTDPGDRSVFVTFLGRSSRRT